MVSSSYPFTWFDRFCLWYPPGWLILFNRHWQHYHDDSDGWIGLEYALFLLPGGFYLAILIRWMRLGFRSPRAPFSPIAPEYQHAFRQEVLMPILQHHFHAELLQTENLPDRAQPLLVVINHAGMCFPWDFLSLGTLLSLERNWVVQPVAHPLFFDHPWLKWWLPAGWPQTLGGVRAERNDLETAVAHLPEQTVLLYAPEGWRGLAKGWPQRHHLATFDPSFVQLSNRYEMPILPVVCLGSEYLHPYAWNFKRLAQALKLPVFPISPLVIPFILFPSMGVWASRSHLRYVIQPLYQPWQLTDGKPVGRSESYALSQGLRSSFQAEIDEWNPKSIATFNSTGQPPQTPS